MYDQSHSVNALKGVLRKRDFLPVKGHSAAAVDEYRRTLLEQSFKSAATDFEGKNPIEVFHLKKKSTYRIKNLADDVVVRKLSKNLARFINQSQRGRNFAIENLSRLLEEGVPYRLYRLDIKSFYESFTKEELLAKVVKLHGLSPISKRHLQVLFSHFHSSGGCGIPRGMAISAVLSDLMMHDFDVAISEHRSVYFYTRYVDDIAILTNGTEIPESFLSSLSDQLPTGLRLNTAKQQITPLIGRSKSISTPTPLLFDLEYLGYKFSVCDALKAKSSKRFPFRDVKIDIADGKIDRAKTRIARSFLDFSRTKNFQLLLDRVSFLTSNFAVIDKNSGRKRLAGIFHSYPLLSPSTTSLHALDTVLRSYVLSKSGRVSHRTTKLLSSTQKRELLRQSFERGHREQTFRHFSMQRISEIQECWINE